MALPINLFWSFLYIRQPFCDDSPIKQIREQLGAPYAANTYHLVYKLWSLWLKCVLFKFQYMSWIKSIMEYLIDIFVIMEMEMDCGLVNLKLLNNLFDRSWDLDHNYIYICLGVCSVKYIVSMHGFHHHIYDICLWPIAFYDYQLICHTFHHDMLQMGIVCHEYFGKLQDHLMMILPYVYVFSWVFLCFTFLVCLFSWRCGGIGFVKKTHSHHYGDETISHLS